MKDLTVGKESKLIFQFATPLLLGNVFQQLYSIINSVIVGNFVGKEAIAAVGASFPLIFALISFAIGITMASTIIISQFFGAKDMKNVRRSIDTMYVFTFFAAIVVTVLGIVFGGAIFRLIHLPQEVLPEAKLYLNVYLLGVIFFFGFNVIMAILRGLGDSKTPLYLLIISTVANILFDLLFVAVFHWGVAGAALGTVISQAATFIGGVIYLNKTHPVVNLSYRKYDFSKKIFNKSLMIGLPTGFQQTFVALGMLALFRIVNKFGTDAAAAFSIAGRIDSFVSLPAMNFAIALSTFVGQNLGAKKPERIREGLKATFYMTSIVSLAFTLVAVFFGRTMMSAFISDPQVIDIGANYLVIVGSFYLFFSTMFVVGSVMRGAGDTLIPMFITLFSLWIIRIPISYALSKHMGIPGIWWGIPIAWFIGMVLSYIYYKTGKWKTKSVVKHFEEPMEEPMI